MSWIDKSIENSKTLKDHYKLHHIDFIIKDRFPKHIDFNRCIFVLSKIIPKHLLKSIDIVYVGAFEFLEKKDFSALYKDGAIYLSNSQTDESEIIDDLIHEIAHACEHMQADFIYSDGRIMKEFLGKRQKLFYLLKAENLNPPSEVQTEIDFSEKLDSYFYEQVGYSTISTIINGLFMSPYSITSIREYFSTSFEEYIQNNRRQLKKMCPVIFSKIDDLIQMEG